MISYEVIMDDLQRLEVGKGSKIDINGKKYLW